MTEQMKDAKAWQAMVLLMSSIVIAICVGIIIGESIGYKRGFAARQHATGGGAELVLSKNGEVKMTPIERPDPDSIMLLVDASGHEYACGQVQTSHSGQTGFEEGGSRE